MTSLLLAAVAALMGCDSASSQCERPLLDDQGEVYPCVTAEDCPRPAHVLLCITDSGTYGQPECVRCRDTQCYTVTPEAC